ncbi:hypothetical protein JOF55_003296 [Haloactinomyces albus]|uniref:Uncharacterized protein n=1 Tax=Haloactinomyces albus TaxID=1352928 RepID=A0AAE4CM96_9ACTN|nr:hypothetical protein [Haloactinomyces albus]
MSAADANLNVFELKFDRPTTVDPSAGLRHTSETRWAMLWRRFERGPAVVWGKHTTAGHRRLPHG